jgi:hypothetical protein
MTNDLKRGESGKFVAVGGSRVLGGDRSKREAPLPGTLAVLLERQYYVITRSQGLRYGITTDQMRYRLEPGGSWQKILPGVYSTLTGPASLDQLQMAALLYAGPGAVLTGPHAVRRHHLICAGGNDVDIVVPPSCQVTSRGYVRIHRTQRMPESVLSTRGITFAPLVRAVGDAARLMVRPEHAKALVCEAVQKGRCSLEDLIAEWKAGPSIGSRMFRVALAELGEDIRSEAERDLQARIQHSDLEKPMYNARLYLPDGTFLGVVDDWWPRAAVGLEVDSRQYHMSRREHSQTMERHNRIEAAGARLLHVLPADIKEKWKPTIYENIRDAIASGNRRPPLDIIAIPHDAKDAKTFLQTTPNS